MVFSDIHIHALYGVDDGAATSEQMYRIVADAYADGTRTLCLTPHCHPGYFGDNWEKTEKAFAELKSWAAMQCPDLRLCLGNELRYSKDCVSWLADGFCRTLNETGWVLVDFSAYEQAGEIVRGLEQLLNMGYKPVLAHVERYRNLHGKKKIIAQLRANGVVLQMDTQSILGGFGICVRMEARDLLKRGMIDIVSSDAHDTSGRPPQMGQAYQYILKKCGEDCANALCRDNAVALFQNT